MPFSGQKIHFLEKNGFLTPCIALPSKVVSELFVWGLISYLFLKKNIPALSGKKCETNFSCFTPQFFQKEAATYCFIGNSYLSIIYCAGVYSVHTTHQQQKSRQKRLFRHIKSSQNINQQYNGQREPNIRENNLNNILLTPQCSPTLSHHFIKHKSIAQQTERAKYFGK